VPAAGGHAGCRGHDPTSAFTDNGDGTVTHATTGLTWKRCIKGETWTGAACSGIAQYYTWSEANALGAGDWRLPSQNELLGLVEWGKVGYPAINTTIFADSFFSPTMSYVAFWSSSAYFDNANSAWRVVFGYGYDQVDGKQGGLHRALLVRDASSGTTSDADRVFNWAESSIYAQFFYPAATTQELAGYTYRYYGGSGHYLGVKDGRLWVFGPATQYQLLDAGALAGWLSQAAGAGF
jgi:hypothetical protein